RLLPHPERRLQGGLPVRRSIDRLQGRLRAEVDPDAHLQGQGLIARRIRSLLAVTLFVFALASSARAELIVRGDLFVRFAGGIAPTALPRHAPAPVEVRVSSTV